MALSYKIHAIGTTDKDGNPCKGTFSVYGNGPRPIASLYANQWEELGKAMPAILTAVRAALKDGKLAGPKEKAAKAQAGRVALA